MKEILFGSLIIGFVIFIVLVFYSVQILDYNKIGLNYSALFKSVEDKTYYSGINLLGIGHTFLEYNLTVDTIEFSKTAKYPSINCRTMDGLNL